MLNIWNWIKGESLEQKEDEIAQLRRLVHEQQMIMEDMQREITELIIAEGDRGCGGCGGCVETEDTSPGAAGSPNTVSNHNSLYAIGGGDFAMRTSEVNEGWPSGES